MILLSCAAFGFVLVARASYINIAVTHARQLQDIIAPAITQAEAAEYRSRFAQIASRDDYSVLISDLEMRARQSELSFPEFSIW